MVVDKHKWLADFLHEKGTLCHHCALVVHEKVEKMPGVFGRENAVPCTKLLCCFQQEKKGLSMY
jgi:hypothetical protein